MVGGRGELPTTRCSKAGAEVFCATVDIVNSRVIFVAASHGGECRSIVSYLV